MAVIEVDSLTKDYGNGRGVFDVSLKVDQGECFGFLGPNGAGKTTLIRHLMGFSHPDAGRARVRGLDCWRNAAALQASIGYLPGEIALPEGMTGSAFLRMMARMRRMDSLEHCDRLLERFELDPHVDTKSMSLGTKRKLAVVVAFMHDPDVLVLDEPTSGLDPIMQRAFIAYIREEKARGKTIFLSSHIFHEVDATCDRIAIIKDGRLAAHFDPVQLKRESGSIFKVTFADDASFAAFFERGYAVASSSAKARSVRVRVLPEEVGSFARDLAALKPYDFQEIPFTLEDYFMQFYKEDKRFEGVAS